MSTVQVDLPEDLLRAASVYANVHSAASASREVAKLLALELYREGSVSLGRAAELCGVSQAEFMQCSTSITFPSTTIRIPVPLNQIKRLSSCCFLEKPIILTVRNAPSVTKASDCS